MRYRLHSVTEGSPLSSSMLKVGSVWRTRLRAQRHANKSKAEGGFQRYHTLSSPTLVSQSPCGSNMATTGIPTLQLLLFTAALVVLSCRRVASTRISKRYQQESRGSSSSSSSEWETAPPGSPRPTREEKIVAGFDRLNQRLADFKMKPVEMADDGACQFRAFAHQVGSISNATLLFLCQSIAILPVATPIGYCCMFHGGQLQLRFDRILAALPCLNSHCRFVLRCWCVCRYRSVGAVIWNTGLPPTCSQAGLRPHRAASGGVHHVFRRH